MIGIAPGRSHRLVRLSRQHRRLRHYLIGRHNAAAGWENTVTVDKDLAGHPAFVVSRTRPRQSRVWKFTVRSNSTGDGLPSIVAGSNCQRFTASVAA